MKKNSLATKGLSLSQAQSISNLCNQRALELGNKLDIVNNYSKTVKVDRKDYVIVTGKPLPKEAVVLLTDKAKLHACQAFLMENIKAKDEMLKDARSQTADSSKVFFPGRPTNYVEATILPQVDETWGKEQLTVGELNELLEVEAFAAHIGQFIHKGGTLDKLRSELPLIPAIEWMTINDGQKTPVEFAVHHTSDDLLKIHEDLAELHRSFEQRVNYFKAKIKNLATAENARIANVNADAEAEVEKTNDGLRTTFEVAQKKAMAELIGLRVEFEKTRQANIKEIAAMRIEVDPRFKETIDMFLNKLPETPQE